MPARPPAPGRLRAGMALAVLGAFAFSGKAIVVKLAYRHGADAVTLLMYRMLLALPFFAVMAWWAGRGRPALQRRDWLGVLGLGVSGYYLSVAGARSIARIAAPLKFQQTVLVELKIRPPCHFPTIAVGVGKICVIAAPEDILRFLHDGPPRIPDQLDGFIDTMVP